ncbi:MAG: type II toxin-antitoxin system VapC family toxin [Candidatus Scalinduaceae bacterium]
MNRFVLDCSVTMSWCFEDENNRYADSVLERLSKLEATVPSIWPLEVTNVLLVGERKKRIKKADSMRFIELLRALPISIDESTTSRAMREVFTLAREYNLSSYDAAYLELTIRLGLPFATSDSTLCRVARRCGVQLVKG